MTTRFIAPTIEIPSESVAITAVRNGKDAIVGVEIPDFGALGLPGDALVDVKVSSPLSNGEQQHPVGRAEKFANGLSVAVDAPGCGGVNKLRVAVTVSPATGAGRLHGLRPYIASLVGILVIVQDPDTDNDTNPESYIKWLSARPVDTAGAYVLPAFRTEGPAVQIVNSFLSLEDLKLRPEFRMAVLPLLMGELVHLAVAHDDEAVSDRWLALKQHAATLAGESDWESFLADPTELHAKIGGVQRAFARQLARAMRAAETAADDAIAA